MLDFDIDWRPWRLVYIGAIAFGVLYITGSWVAAGISLLAYVDITSKGLDDE